MRFPALVFVLALAGCGAVHPERPSMVLGQPTEMDSPARAATIGCLMHITILSEPGPTATLYVTYDTKLCGNGEPVWWCGTATITPRADHHMAVLTGPPGVHEVQAMEFPDPGAGYDIIRVTLLP